MACYGETRPEIQNNTIQNKYTYIHIIENITLNKSSMSLTVCMRLNPTLKLSLKQFVHKIHI